MLACSLALARSQRFSLARSAVRTFSSPSSGVVHPSRLYVAPGSTETEQVEDVSLPLSIANEKGRTALGQVFEENSEEYLSVASASPPPKPSVVDIIANTLPPLLPQPPTDGASIFEEDSAEYESVSPTIVGHAQPIDLQLWKLLHAKQYNRVYDILLESKQLDQVLWFHPEYEAAAIATLDDLHEAKTPLALSEKLKRFETFFSYVPPSWAVEKERTFSEIRKRILNAPLINMDFIIRFSLILIQKGYRELIHKYTIPIITRFAPSEICLEFVSDAINANKRCHSPNGNRLEKLSSFRLRAAVIYWLSFSHRLDEAITLLPREDDLDMDGFKLSPFTHGLLRFRLEESSNPEHHQVIPYVDSLLLKRRHIQRPVNHVSKGLGSAESQYLVQRATSSFFPELAEIETDIAIDMELPSSTSEHTLAVKLRRIKDVFSRPEDNLFSRRPPISEVLSFFHEYLAFLPDKNGHAIGLLRRHAIRSGRGTASRFLFLEMLYYYRAGMFGLVVETFVDHFYICALPREDVLANYQKFCDYRKGKIDASQDFSDDGTEQLFRMGMSEPDPSLGDTRLWPGSRHTSLMWHALVALTPQRGLLQLYQKLLQIAAEGYATMSGHSQSPKSYSTELVPSTWRVNVPSTAFTPFLRRMLRSCKDHGSAASLGASMLDDMIHAGTEPNLHHLTVVASFYARIGDSRRAFIIMDSLERLVQERKSRPGTRTHDPESDGTLFPIPDIVFYCAVLRAFINDRNLADAERVASRIKQLDNPYPGTEEITWGQYGTINELRQDLAVLRLTQRDEERMTSDSRQLALAAVVTEK